MREAEVARIMVDKCISFRGINVLLITPTIEESISKKLLGAYNLTRDPAIMVLNIHLHTETKIRERLIYKGLLKLNSLFLRTISNHIM
jgi:hypothetical protein